MEFHDSKKVIMNADIKTGFKYGMHNLKKYSYITCSIKACCLNNIKWEFLNILSKKKH